MTAIVFGAYLAAIFAIGAVALRRTRTEGDYWIAGGKLGWLLGGATLAATHASAGTYIGTVGVIHTVGWEFTWLVLFIPFSYWFMAGGIGPPLRPHPRADAAGVHRAAVLQPPRPGARRRGHPCSPSRSTSRRR